MVNIAGTIRQQDDADAAIAGSPPNGAGKYGEFLQFILSSMVQTVNLRLEVVARVQVETNRQSAMTRCGRSFQPPPQGGVPC
jgi:hypothetical protein